MVRGIEDLRTPLSTILRLDKALRGTLSGFMMPAFVIDLPGGGGKRLVSSKESYCEKTGVAVYTAPGLPGSKGRRTYEYHDPKPVSKIAVEELRQDQEQALEQNMTLQDLVRPTVPKPGSPRPLRRQTFNFNITVPRKRIPVNVSHAGVKPEDLALQLSTSNYNPSSSAATA
jgi:lysine 2,3-aminomutase